MEPTVKFECGHEATVTIVGRPEDIERQIEEFGGMKCKACRMEQNPKPKGFIYMAKEPRKAPSKKPKDDDEKDPPLETEGQTGPPAGDKDDD